MVNTNKHKNKTALGEMDALRAILFLYINYLFICALNAFIF